MQMNEEMQKRIEDELESIWNGDRKDIEYKFKNFDTGFEEGAKFILEMPELRAAIEALKWYAKKDEGPYTDARIYRRAEFVLESLKKAGLCE